MAAAGYTALGILGAGAVIIPVVVLRAHHVETARVASATAAAEAAQEVPLP